MARKDGAGTLEDQREALRKKASRGRTRNKALTSPESMEEFERRAKQEMLCYFKASDFSHTYCADALGVSRSTITAWLDDDELALRPKIEKLRKDMTTAAVMLVQTYAVEIVEMQMQIIRETDDEKLASEIGFKLLDRIGIAPVNKSESITAKTITQKDEVEITDRTGLLERTRGAPPEVQARLAAMTEDMLSLAREHAAPVAPEPEPEPETETVDA